LKLCYCFGSLARHGFREDFPLYVLVTLAVTLLVQAYFIFSEREQHFDCVKGVLAKTILLLFQARSDDGVRERVS
jgi:hypothetical protein